MNTTVWWITQGFEFAYKRENKTVALNCTITNIYINRKIITVVYQNRFTRLAKGIKGKTGHRMS